MNEPQKELFREAVLRVMDTNRTRFGLPVAAIQLRMGVFGFPAPNSDDIADALEYLARKGLAEESFKVLSPGNRAWRITAAGIDYVDERG